MTLIRPRPAAIQHDPNGTDVSLAHVLRIGGFEQRPLEEMDNALCTSREGEPSAPAPKDCAGLRVETANFGWIPGVSSPGDHFE